MVQENENQRPGFAGRPSWLSAMSPEDLAFVKRFILASGSLKAIAGQYGVSYPTIRARVDRLIEKVRVADDDAPDDPLDREVRLLVADGRISVTVAQSLLDAHRASLEARREGGLP